MKRLGFSPWGTARERLEERTRKPRGARHVGALPFPLELRQTLSGRDIGEETVFLAWELARSAPALDLPSQRALFLLALASLVNERAGGTRLPLEGPDAAALQRFFDELEIDAATRATAAKLWRAVGTPGFEKSAAAPVLGGPGSFTPLLVDRGFLYTQRMLHFEERLSKNLAERLARPELSPPKASVEEALKTILAAAPVVRGEVVALSDEQQRAVLAALKRPLSIVSGGPGTGKTSIVVSLLRMLVRLGVKLETIALAAPTGKAAHRMSEAIRQSLGAIPSRDSFDEELFTRCPPPQTLHRLLGYSPTTGRFRHHENSRLNAAVVIVDEASMIDLFLLDSLVRATGSEARLVLIGDAGQLPSVEAGAVFRDLVPESGSSSAAVQLTRSYRMDARDPAGRNLFSVASRIREGQVSGLFDASSAEQITLREHPAELAFERLELLAGSERDTREAFLSRWHQERLRGLPDLERLEKKIYRRTESGFSDGDLADLRTLFAHFDRSRLLCVTRETGFASADAVNRQLHRRALDAFLESGEGEGLDFEPRFLPGEPVVVQENDYALNLFNGDQGLVLRVQESKDERHRFRAVFPRGLSYFAVHLDALRAELALSYAVTVHKAQGSEFDFVGVLLPDQDLPLLTRELLYTAITRSRRSVVIVGSQELLLAGVGRKIERFSGIAERLAMLLR